MNNLVKILLTVELTGTLGPQQDNFEIIPFSYNTDLDGNPIPEVRGHMKHKNRAVKPCTQHYKMTQDAYNQMISDETPYWSKEETWKKLTIDERIQAHCARIANGNKFNFQILE